MSIAPSVAQGYYDLSMAVSKEGCYYIDQTMDENEEGMSVFVDLLGFKYPFEDFMTFKELVSTVLGFQLQNFAL